jgi:hypothetical protein
MKKLFFFVIAGIIISACSNSNNKVQSADPTAQNEVVITNDMENAKAVIPSWLSEKTVVTMNEIPAHSGQNACITNDTMEFGYVYDEIVKNINNKIPRLVTYSGWVYTTIANPKFSIICAINENNVLYDWKSFPLEKELSEVGKWVEFTTSFYFTEKPLKPENDIKLYAWNQSKKPIYIDDLRITFSY